MLGRITCGAGDGSELHAAPCADAVEAAAIVSLAHGALALEPSESSTVHSLIVCCPILCRCLGDREGAVHSMEQVHHRTAAYAHVRHHVLLAFLHAAFQGLGDHGKR